TKKPRGFGGVVLIMLLLVVLFLMVQKAGIGQQTSLYDFYRVLFNGDIAKLEWIDDGRTLDITYRKPGEEGARTGRMEFKTGGFADSDRDLIRSIIPHAALDVTMYQGGLDPFADDIEKEEIHVERAMIVSMIPSQRTGEEDAPKLFAE